MESDRSCRPRHVSLREDLKWASQCGAGSLLAFVLFAHGDWGVLVGSALVIALSVLTGVVQRHRARRGQATP